MVVMCCAAAGLLLLLLLCVCCGCLSPRSEEVNRRYLVGAPPDFDPRPAGKNPGTSRLVGAGRLLAVAAG